MTINERIVSLGKLEQYSNETSENIKEYVNNKISEVIHPDYDLVKKNTADEGFTASYNLTKNGEIVGATINIPKDYLVKSADIKVVEMADTPVEGYVVGDKYIDFVVNTVDDSGNVSHIYLLVTELVDVYKAGDGIVIGTDNTITLVIQDGTKTVGGVSADDYNAFKSAVEDSHIHSNMSVLDKIDESVVKGGNSLSGSTGYSVDDSVDYPLVGLKVFGKSTQDGTPTPENPVEIVSVTQPTVTVCGKNLLNPTLQTTTRNGVTCTNNGDGTYTLNGSCESAFHFVLCTIGIMDGAYKLIGLKSFGTGLELIVLRGGTWNNPIYATEQGTVFNDMTTDNNAVIIYVKGNFAFNNAIVKPMLTTDLTATYDDYEPYTANTLTIPDTLNAIPVSSGGNVTIDGQRYIADYVDFERGVKVKNIHKVTITEDLLNVVNTSKGLKFCEVDKSFPSKENYDSTMFPSNFKNGWSVQCIAISSKFISIIAGDLSVGFKQNSILLFIEGTRGLIIIGGENTELSEFKEMCPFDLYYQLATPIETSLSENELQAYRQLHTYNGVTNISNDKGAGLSVEYCTSKMLAEYALPLIKDLEAENAKKDEEISVLKTDILNNEKIHNRIYEGVNLSEKFASEIAASPYNGDVWAWIKARISAEDFTGIHVGDYIPFTTTNGITLNAQIAGINTYKNYGDTAVGAHIDFICKELWGTLHPINKVAYNNGTTNQNHPWLASDLYLFLNSLSGSVPNGTAVNPETVEVDYTTDGVYYYLPDALKSVIKEKRFLLPKRYSASGLLTDDNQWGWANIGKLWLPDECEVYGIPVWGGKGGYSLSGSSLQYPIFTGNINRLKFRNGSRYNWWLLSPYSGSTSHWCFVSNVGSCNAYSLVDSNIAVPICFRV